MLHASEQERPDVQQARAEFRAWVATIPSEHLIFLDEFGVNLGMTRRYGRALDGQRAVGTQPSNPGPNVTLTLALGLRGVLAPFTFQGATDGRAFETYLRTQLAPHLHPGDVVLADGVGAHRIGSAEAIVAERGATYRILPPYSPDFSPVENSGGKVKHTIRQAEPRTVEALEAVMKTALEGVTPHDALGWFHLKGYAPQPRLLSPRRAHRERAPLARSRRHLDPPTL